MILCGDFLDNYAVGIRWQSEFIYQPWYGRPDGEWEDVWKRQRETKKMDTALARWVYYNPESAWTYSGDSLIVLITT